MVRWKESLNHWSEFASLNGLGRDHNFAEPRAKIIANEMVQCTGKTFFPYIYLPPIPKSPVHSSFPTLSRPYRSRFTHQRARRSGPPFVEAKRFLRHWNEFYRSNWSRQWQWHLHHCRQSWHHWNWRKKVYILRIDVPQARLTVSIPAILCSILCFFFDVIEYKSLFSLAQTCIGTGTALLITTFIYQSTNTLSPYHAYMILHLALMNLPASWVVYSRCWSLAGLQRENTPSQPDVRYCICLHSSFLVIP